MIKKVFFLNPENLDSYDRSFHRSKTVSGHAKIFRLDPNNFGMDHNDFSVCTEFCFLIHDQNILIQSKKKIEPIEGRGSCFGNGSWIWRARYLFF